MKKIIILMCILFSINFNYAQEGGEGAARYDPSSYVALMNEFSELKREWEYIVRLQDRNLLCDDYASRMSAFIAKVNESEKVMSEEHMGKCQEAIIDLRLRLFCHKFKDGLKFVSDLGQKSYEETLKITERMLAWHQDLERREHEIKRLKALHAMRISLLMSRIDEYGRPLTEYYKR